MASSSPQHGADIDDDMLDDHLESTNQLPRSSSPPIHFPSSSDAGTPKRAQRITTGRSQTGMSSPLRGMGVANRKLIRSRPVHRLETVPLSFSRTTTRDIVATILTRLVPRKSPQPHLRSPILLRLSLVHLERVPTTLDAPYGKAAWRAQGGATSRHRLQGVVNRSSMGKFLIQFNSVLR